MEKKNVVLLSVIAVATLLITVVGATFAYYAAQITGNPTGNSVEITSTDGFTITYDGGNTIEDSNILPGWKSQNEYSMTVSNGTDYDVKYTIKWTAVTNGLAESDQKNLTYTTTATTAWIDEQLDGEELTTATNPAADATQFPAEDGGTFATQTLKPGEKITYTINLDYAYKEDEIQNPDYLTGSTSKTFTAKLNIDDSDIEVRAHVKAGA